jgi:hypothetical protein
MAIARVAKGTNSSKASVTSLSVNNVTINEGTHVIVGLAYEDSQGNPTSVKFGNYNLSLVPDSRINNSSAGLTVATYGRLIQTTMERDIVATWSAAIDAKVMIVLQVEEVSQKDRASTNTQTNATAPTSGVTAQTTVADTLAVGFLASKGPVEDTIGTPSDGASSGQRDGTTGGDATSNITLHELYHILSSQSQVRARKTGVESLERGIEAARKNIQTFEEAIDKERETIKEYRRMIAIIEEKAKIPKEIVIDMSSEKIIEKNQEFTEEDGD